jgi:curved DNA-binding protein
VEFKDYYATLGVDRKAEQADIKRAYRKLARKYHPDVSKEPDAEAHFKEVSEAYEALHDPEKRAAYDSIGQRPQGGQEFRPPPGWNSGFEFSGRDSGLGSEADFSDFFESLFGRRTGAGVGRGAARSQTGDDHHAKIVIELEDSYTGAQRTISLRVPVADALGHITFQERQLDVTIPRGVREGQHMRLAGQGGQSGGAAGDLYLEVAFNPHGRFRVDGRDVYVDLPITPWEAALGASIVVPTPEGDVQVKVAPGSTPGRKLRLKGRGLPSDPAGDMYVVIRVAMPPADTPEAKEAYAAMQSAFPGFNPRSTMEA